jgi:error-prone DNA polymerase
MTVPPAYAELAMATAYSFLRGASHAHELVERARDLGLAALAVTDRNSLAGVVRAHVAARDCGLKLVIGARLAFEDGAPDVLAYAPDRAAYGQLSRLITRGAMRDDALKGQCRLVFGDLATELGQDGGGLLFALMAPARPGDDLMPWLERLSVLAPGRCWLAATQDMGAADARRLDRLARLAERAGTPLLAVNDVVYHDADRRPLHDVMTCIREHVTLAEAGPRLLGNGERRLKSPAEMVRLFRDHPAAVTESLRLAGLCRFSLDELTYEYPNETAPAGLTPQAHLEALTWDGARWRYPHGIPQKVSVLLREEFALISYKDYARYFLTVHDVVRFARSRGILCQGRGSAANSAVCYCLGITAVDPTEHDLLFARFISTERDEPPDIDVDFEHERREEVIQYIYARYGRHRAAICATVIHYRPRSAIREAGKVFGLSEDVTGALAGMVWGAWGEAPPDDHVRQAGLDPQNPVIAQAVAMARELLGFPRHLSQHVGGFVLTEGRLDETVPVVNAAMPDRTFIEWDKDDIDALGLMKVDVLALGMLTCIRKAFALLGLTELADVPQDDPAVYDMLCAADSVGVFQVESRAQMNMLPRLRPRTFYDLVIEVAIVRPGPIQGDMVHPYLRRRQGLETPELPGPAGGDPDELRKVLGKTLGVPLFQEQAMQIAITAAGFTPAQADGLRRAMATFRNVGTIERYRTLLVEGMTARGYQYDFAERCFKQIEGFGSYGFPESHAASFAKLVYVSSWLKRHHPAAFCCAILNSQPMGFYAPAQLVRDAREHGVEVRPIDVEASLWDCTLEDTSGEAASSLQAEPGEDMARPAVRLGFRMVDGASQAWVEQLVQGRAEAGGRFGDFDRFVRFSRLTSAQMLRLADADALRGLGLDRRAALWRIKGLETGAPAPLLAALPDQEETPELPRMAVSEHVVADYQTHRLSLRDHPMSFLRSGITALGARPCAALKEMADRQRLITAGVVLVRQRPGGGKVCFITVEDETGVANLVVMPEVFAKYRKVIMSARLMLAEGRIQRSPEGIVHLLCHRLADESPRLAALTEPDLFAPDRSSIGDTLARADEVKRGERPVPPPRHSHPRNVRVLPRSRDFH